MAIMNLINMGAYKGIWAYLGPQNRPIWGLWEGLFGALAGPIWASPWAI